MHWTFVVVVLCSMHCCVHWTSFIQSGGVGCVFTVVVNCALLVSFDLKWHGIELWCGVPSSSSLYVAVVGFFGVSSWKLEVRIKVACLLLRIFDGRRPLNAILRSWMLFGASHYFLPSSVYILRCVLLFTWFPLIWWLLTLSPDCCTLPGYFSALFSTVGSTALVGRMAFPVQ